MQCKSDLVATTALLVMEDGRSDDGTPVQETENADSVAQMQPEGSMTIDRVSQMLVHLTQVIT